MADTGTASLAQTGAHRPEARFADITAGDIVVHLEYGIGKFQGLRPALLAALNANICRSNMPIMTSFTSPSTMPTG
ncbi:MAG: hypothetical protein H6669_15715 [Ardenticatenaceae bacterium]|nr:hypothetical protein [Ardenticatenaceae bacterium]